MMDAQGHTPPRAAFAGLLLCVLSLAALPCRAEDAPIATAPQGQTADAKSDAVAQIPEGRAPQSEAPQGEPELDRRPHGVIEVGVGTGGYRRAAGVVTAPLGKTGQITVAVDKTEGPARWR